jgi:multiple sugar transport system permease protein
VNKRDARIGWLFASPWLIGFTLFLVYPVVASFAYSFTRYSMLKPPSPIGAANYVEMSHDPVFFKALGNTFLYVLGAVPLATVMAIALALLLNSKVKGMAVYRTLFFLPTLVPMAALGVLFLWVFNGDYGILNAGIKPVLNGSGHGLLWLGVNVFDPILSPFHFKSLLDSWGTSLIHTPPPNWLGDPAWSKWTLILISVWGCGQAMIIYLAGLQDVPVSLYEACEIDGAKPWAKTRHVTLPLISPVILFNVVMAIIGALQVFAVPYIMFLDGAPARSTYVITTYLFDTAFRFQRMGYACAMGWVMFIITMLLTFIALKFSERHVHYEGG